MSDALASSLAAAYRGNTLLKAADLAAPRNLGEAMATHVALTKALDAKVGGWKVGIRPDGEGFGAPLFANTIVASGASHPIHPAAGWTGIEIEIALRLGKDLTPREGGYTREDIIAATDSVLIGIEVVEARLHDHRNAPYELFVADLMANRGYVTGGETRDWRGLDLAALRCVLEVDGVVTHDAIGGHPQNDPLLPVIALANRPDQPLGGMRKGEIITTGALCGLIPMEKPCRIRATIEKIGAVEMRLT